MDALLQVAGTLALALTVLVLLMVGVTSQRLLHLRWQPVASQPLQRDDVPAPVRRVLEQGVAPLLELGFRYSFSGSATSALVGSPMGLQYFDAYEHPDGHSHAVVLSHDVPSPQHPVQVQLVTCLTNGNNWTTLNGTRHLAPFDFPRWPVFDDYLPQWKDAWQRHLERVQFAQSRICTDSLEVQRRVATAYEKLIPALVQQGKLVGTDAGATYRLSAMAALRMAVGLWVGQLRAAWSQRGQKPAPTPATPPTPGTPAGAGAPVDAVEADLQAYTAQRTLLQGRPRSARSKWLVFGITALLFLLVGGWWMSWSFVPVVLAVVALHEGGHYLAMKLTGYRNVSVFFLPGLGGLAVGEKADATPTEKVLVYLAGPVPGMVLAAAAFWASRTGVWQAPDWLNGFLLASFVINYLNLLPLVPLDGGRVMELLLFARHPRLRFAFAVLCCALLLVGGFWMNDLVLRAVAVLIALGLPAQWRRARLDPLVARDHATALDEPTALRRIFTALQDARFRTWSFAQRSAAATALLPEVMARQARRTEVVLGLLVYAVCLLAPVGAALWTVPHLGDAIAIMAQTPRVPPDDVVPDPAANAASAPTDWTARLATAASLTPQEQLAAYLGAARQAQDAENSDTALRHYLSAWTLAQGLPARDLRRIEALEGLADVSEDAAQRKAYLQQIIAELDQPVGDERLHVATAREHMAWDEPQPAQRVALLEEALKLRKVGLGTDEALAATRLQLARALDDYGDTAAAQTQLLARVEDLPWPQPQDRSRAALQQRIQRLLAQVDLTWFLLAHEHFQEARRSADYAQHLLPPTITASWVVPQQQALEAALWVHLLAAQSTGLAAQWKAYDAARHYGFGRHQTLLVHEADRALVAQQLGDAALLAQAREGVTQSRAQLPPSGSALCRTVDAATAGWRAPQRMARKRILTEMGVCAGT